MNKNKTLLIIDVQFDFLKYRNGEINQELINIFEWLIENKDYVDKNYTKKIQIVDNIEYFYNIEDMYPSNYELIQDKTFKEYYAMKNGLLFNIEDYVTFLDEKEKEDTYEALEKYMQEKHYSNFLNDIIYKEYGFLRDFMDYIRNSSEKDKLETYIIDIIKIMIKYNLGSTDEFNENFIKSLNLSEEKENDFLEMYVDMRDNGGYTPYNLSLPSNNLIENITNNISKNEEIELIGGGRNECLKEIYLLLKGLGYENVKINEELVYY